MLTDKEMFSAGRLKDTMMLIFVDEHDKVDRLFKAAHGSEMVFARPYVIHQWLSILAVVHPHYNNFVVPSLYQIQRDIDEANLRIQEAARITDNPDMVDFERELGSDTTDQLGDFAQHKDGMVSADDDNWCQLMKMQESADDDS